jgi:hypothetical protein
MDISDISDISDTDDKINYILKHPGILNLQNERGDNPIMMILNNINYVSDENRDKIINFIDETININLQNKDGMTVLMKAIKSIEYCNIENLNQIIIKLIDKSDIDLQDEKNKTALVYFIEKLYLLNRLSRKVNDLENAILLNIFNSIVNKVSNINIMITNKISNTESHIRSYLMILIIFLYRYPVKYHTEFVLKLLEKRIDINLKDDLGQTALFYAIKSQEFLYYFDYNVEKISFSPGTDEKRRIMKILLLNDLINAEIKDMSGRTAFIGIGGFTGYQINEINEKLLKYPKAILYYIDTKNNIRLDDTEKLNILKSLTNVGPDIIELITKKTYDGKRKSKRRSKRKSKRRSKRKSKKRQSSKRKSKRRSKRKLKSRK